MADRSDTKPPATEYQVKETMVCYRCGGRFWRVERYSMDTLVFLVCRICNDPNYQVKRGIAVRMDLPR